MVNENKQHRPYTMFISIKTWLHEWQRLHISHIFDLQKYYSKCTIKFDLSQRHLRPDFDKIERWKRAGRGNPFECDRCFSARINSQFYRTSAVQGSALMEGTSYPMTAFFSCSVQMGRCKGMTEVHFTLV